PPPPDPSGAPLGGPHAARLPRQGGLAPEAVQQGTRRHGLLGRLVGRRPGQARSPVPRWRRHTRVLGPRRWPDRDHEVVLLGAPGPEEPAAGPTPPPPAGRPDPHLSGPAVRLCVHP